jgi:glucokinase
MYLGIEIGGTKLQLGIGPGDGTVKSLWRGTVDVYRGGEGIREQILAETPSLLKRAGLTRADIEAVGVGFGGPVNDADQTVLKSHQIKGWDGFPLGKWLTDLLGWPVALGNDADVAGLAEALFGAGKGLSPIFYITIGSGIGGGLIIDGQIYRGFGNGAAEIGHLNVGTFATPITLESWASGWGIASTFEKTWGRKWASQQIADAARMGDGMALHILNEAWNYLALGITQVIALLCPRRIVIGGGVSLMGEELFFEPLRKKVASRVFRPFAGCYDIVPASLGEEVVVHGALALAKESAHARWAVPTIQGE